ncbi:hypothetical protein KC957_03410, partial [Candidatus Saccharibacteria bacterium]|nr:hypothetical protein [Candidatus Saccharibacteria bacterium]
MQYAALLFLAVVQVCLGVVFGYRRRSQASQAFILLAVVLLLWNLANVTLDASLNGKFFHDPEVRLLAINWANRLGFFFGASVIAALNVVVSILFSHKAWSR